MKVSQFKEYIKESYKRLIIEFVVCATVAYYSHDYWVIAFFYLLTKLRDIYHLQEKQERRQKLRAKGLTEHDVANIDFVKKWQETRKGGLWRYCIRDGGLIAGAGTGLALSLLFGLCFSVKFLKILSEPGDMFAFISYNYLCGAAIQIIIFRFLWFSNERRFLRLTDPLNSDLFAKAGLLNELP